MRFTIIHMADTIYISYILILKGKVIERNMGWNNYAI